MQRWMIGREQELALLLAGTKERRVRNAERIACLARTVDPPRFRRVAQQQRMSVLLQHRIRAAGADPQRLGLVSPEAERDNALRALRLRGVSDLLATAFESDGIPVMPLKGVTLAKRLYGDEALRSVNDVDFLVPAGDLHASVAASRELGYDLAGSSVNGLPRLHLVFTNAQRYLPPLEVHWRVHWYETEFSADMLNRSTGAGAQRVPELGDELASLLLFYQRDGLTGLRLACDIATWWDRFGDQLPSGVIAALSCRYPLLEPAWTAAALAAARIVGLPSERLLKSARPSSRRVGLAVALANWPMLGDRDQIGSDVTLIDGLCSPAHQLAAFARRSLIVSDEQLSRYYKISPDARVVLRAMRVAHPLKLGVRYALALWRLLRRAIGHALRGRSAALAPPAAP